MGGKRSASMPMWLIYMEMETKMKGMSTRAENGTDDRIHEEKATTVYAAAAVKRKYRKNGCRIWIFMEQG